MTVLYVLSIIAGTLAMVGLTWGIAVAIYKASYWHYTRKPDTRKP